MPDFMALYIGVIIGLEFALKKERTHSCIYNTGKKQHFLMTHTVCVEVALWQLLCLGTRLQQVYYCNIIQCYTPMKRSIIIREREC